MTSVLAIIRSAASRRFPFWAPRLGPGIECRAIFLWPPNDLAEQHRRELSFVVSCPTL